jgi:hypothetical protein
MQNCNIAHASRSDKRALLNVCNHFQIGGGMTSAFFGGSLLNKNGWQAFFNS